MPRARRYELVDLPQHIVQRGNNRQATFRELADYRLYLAWLAEAAAREACEIHAYVLMTNHVHLLVTPGRPMAIGRMMQSLGRRYVRYFNDSYGRTGTLWEGRHRASIVASGEYLMTCYRYIELNPVRASLVENPAEYPWSSHRCNAWMQPDSMVSQHGEYSALGPSWTERAMTYRALFDSEIAPAMLAQLRRDLHESRPFGPERFKDDVERMLGRRVRAGKAGRPKARPDAREQGEIPL
jgi:putative transposase